MKKKLVAVAMVGAVLIGGMSVGAQGADASLLKAKTNQTASFVKAPQTPEIVKLKGEAAAKLGNPGPGLVKVDVEVKPVVKPAVKPAPVVKPIVKPLPGLVKVDTVVGIMPVPDKFNPKKLK